MDKIFVTVLIMKKFEQGWQLKKGDIVELVKEPDNEHDKDAIRVNLIGEGENQVGYIANNKDNTVLEGTLSASEVKDMFKTKTKVRLIELTEDRGFMKLFRAEIIPEKHKNTKKEIVFRLTGAFSTYAGKKDLVKDIKIGEKSIKITKLENGRIIGQYNGMPAGIVTADDEIIEIIENYLEDLPEVIAIATSADRGNVICKLEEVNNVKTSRLKLKEILDNIINKGINTKEEIEEKLNYLRRNKVSELDISLLFESYVDYSEDIKSRISKPKVLYVDSVGILSDAISYINVGKNLLFEGDMGVGKNVLAATLAWLYNRPLYQFSLNSQHSNNSLLGGKTFKTPEETEIKKKKRTAARLLSSIFSALRKEKAKDIKEEELIEIENMIDIFSNKNNQELVFETSPILEAFMHGGILVLDEFNTALAHVMTMFHSLLDDRREIEITGYGLIKGHKNFCAIATQNRDYQGTFATNEATADRFEPIIFPPLTSLMEMLKERVPNISYDVLIMANKLYTGIKEAVETGDVSNQALSPRGFISACQVIVNGKNPKRAFEISIANRVTNLDERSIIKNIIDLQIGD